MKKYILNAIAIFTFATGLSSCGDSFLETDNYKGVDLEGGLNTVTNVSTALNGTYYQLFYYAFAGNYALAIGDIPTDITYWNTKTGHFDGIYTYEISLGLGLKLYVDHKVPYELADQFVVLVIAKANILSEFDISLL